MKLVKVLSIVFLLIAGFIAYKLVASIKYEIDTERRIKKVEAKIIDKLQMARKAQIVYLNSYGSYAGSWDTLISYIDTGKIYITERKEHVITLDYGADSVAVEIDTLGTVSVKDSLYASDKYPDFKPEKLPIVPYTGDTFEIYAGEINKGNVTVDVFEIKDPNPINPKRLEENSRGPLRVGSRDQVTTSGNWE